MRIKEISCEQRPRERLKKLGKEALSDAELLAIILKTGFRGENVIDVSNKIISSFGLDNLSNCSLAELTKLKGIGQAKASQIIAAFELAKRKESGTINETIIRNSSDIAQHYIAKLKDKKKEYFIAVFLDSKNKIIKDEVISIGTLNSSLVHPREIFKEAIKNSANSIILVHNHPSGDCTPSEEDLRITARLREAGELVNIPLLDHIVVGKEAHKSVN